MKRQRPDTAKGGQKPRGENCALFEKNIKGKPIKGGVIDWGGVLLNIRYGRKAGGERK